MSRGGSTRDCDVVVLGSGPAASTPRASSPRPGWTWSGSSEALVGGECPFWGCTPSKLMVRPADLLAEVRRADRLAGDADVRPDWSLVAARIREANHDWTDEPPRRAARARRGDASCAATAGSTDRGVVRVERDGAETVLRAARGVLLNTGTEPLRPPIDGLEDTPYWTNREAMKVTEVPRPRWSWSAADRTGSSWPRSSRGTAPG